MIYVYTAILNGFDNLRAPAVPADEFVRFICYTNIPNLPRVYPWEYRPIYAATGDAARDSRIPKILPHLMLPPDADYSIWHDGNFQLRLDPHAIINELLQGNDWAAHKHPARNCIYKEAEILLREKIGTPSRVEKDIAAARAIGYPENNGLWANGMIVRRHSGAVAELNLAWWRAFSEGCERDQISFPIARHSLNFPVRTIDADVWSGPYLKFNWHAAWQGRLDNPDYQSERARIRGRLAELARVTGSDAGIKYHEY